MTDKTFSIYAPISKYEEQPDGTLMVFGRATQEVVDSAQEIMDYESSAPFFQRRSQENSDRSNGQNLMPLRSMHQPIAAGKVVQLDYVDAEKAIDIASLVVDEQEIKKVTNGVYTGFSVGGRYARKWPDPSGKGMRYTADPREISLVDAPAVPTARLTLFKSDDVSEEENLTQEPEWVEKFRAAVEEVKALRRSDQEEHNNLLNQMMQIGESAGIAKRDGSLLKPTAGNPTDPAEYGDPGNLLFPADAEHIAGSIDSFNSGRLLIKYSTREQHTLGRRLTAIGNRNGGTYVYDPTTMTIARKENPMSELDLNKLDVGGLVAQLKAAGQQAAVMSDPSAALAMLQGAIDSLNVGSPAGMGNMTPVSDPSVALKADASVKEEPAAEEKPTSPASTASPSDEKKEEKKEEAAATDVYKALNQKVTDLEESVKTLVDALTKSVARTQTPTPAPAAESPMGALNSLINRDQKPESLDNPIIKALEEGGPYALIKALKAAGSDDEIGGALAWQNMNNAIRKATYDSLEQGGVVTARRYGGRLFNG